MTDLKEVAYVFAELLEEFPRSSRRVLPGSESSRKSGRICAQNDVYPEQFLLMFTVLPKGSEGSRRPPGDGLGTFSRIE